MVRLKRVGRRPVFVAGECDDATGEATSFLNRSGVSLVNFTVRVLHDCSGRFSTPNEETLDGGVILTDVMMIAGVRTWLHRPQLTLAAAPRPRGHKGAAAGMVRQTVASLN